MAETIEEVSYNYEDEGKLVRKEMKKEILTKGAWATVMFLYQELDRKTEQWGPPKVSIVRFKKSGGVYRKQSSFNISSEKQARQIVEVIEKWYAEVGPQPATRRRRRATTPSARVRRRGLTRRRRRALLVRLAEAIEEAARLLLLLFAHVDEPHLALGVEQARVELVRLLEHVVGAVDVLLFLEADAEVVVGARAARRQLHRLVEQRPWRRRRSICPAHTRAQVR